MSDFHFHACVGRMIECKSCYKPLPKGTDIYRLAVLSSKYPRAYHKECALRDLKECAKEIEKEMSDDG